MSFRRYAGLAVIAAAGVGAAYPFARPGSKPATSLATQDEQRTVTAPLVPHIAVETAGTAASPLPLAEPAGEPDWAHPQPIVLPPSEEPLPRLPHMPVTRRFVSQGGSKIHEPDFRDATAAPPPVTTISTVKPKPAPLRHRIADGDSLKHLALRYLGDESRSGEIARLNGDVIRDPNLLPVGREILIPSEP
jgi:nucleoid-associated protein YgaU